MPEGFKAREAGGFGPVVGFEAFWSCRLHVSWAAVVSARAMHDGSEIMISRSNMFRRVSPVTITKEKDHTHTHTHTHCTQVGGEKYDGRHLPHRHGG